MPPAPTVNVAVCPCSSPCTGFGTEAPGNAGFTVIGIDISEEKVRRVNAGDSYVGDIPSSTLAPLVEAGRLRATTDFSAVLDLDVRYLSAVRFGPGRATATALGGDLVRVEVRDAGSDDRLAALIFARVASTG